MPLTIIRNDITKMNTDAIVNAASGALQNGGGVCGAIFSAAGVDKLQKACNRIGACGIGHAVITEGYDLPSKYIIHTAGPAWQGGNSGERNLLYGCYRNSLELARRAKCGSVAFPLISSGENGFPKDQALRVAVKAIGDFLRDSDADMMVMLVIFGDASFSISNKLRSSIKTFLDSNRSKPHNARVSQSEFESLRRAATSHLPPEQSEVSGFLNPLSIRREKQYSSFAREQGEAGFGGLHSHQRSLDDVLSQAGETFSKMLFRLIDERDLSDAVVYRRANITRSVFSQCRKEDYRPSKGTAIALAIALELSLDVTHDLLRKAGLALSPSSKHDLIIQYYISEGIYDIFEINETLFRFDQRLLGV
jgi:O-acetyl-ADP-ribose deacetylase (regulator of RNase III)